MFDYNEAFSRNIGWVTKAEQLTLKNSKVAIGGLGGVGGDHAIVCARLGIGEFNISDLDDYDIANFNRQAGANIHTVGRPKSEVMLETLQAINPSAAIRNFDTGINEQNLEEFLDGVDIYIDSLDIFALDIRRKVFRRCYEKGIPAITCAPMGMGAALLCFIPGEMSFDDYFDMVDSDPSMPQAMQDKIFRDNIMRFVIGLSPRVPQRHYLVEKSSVNFLNKKVPSTCMGISLSAGLLCSNVLKLVLNRGHVIHAPRAIQFDAYRNKMYSTYRPWGNKNPLQKLMFWRLSQILDQS